MYVDLVPDYLFLLLTSPTHFSPAHEIPPTSDFLVCVFNIRSNKLVPQCGKIPTSAFGS